MTTTIPANHRTAAPSDCIDSDLAALKAIARVSHQDSRFYFDRRFAEASAAALYERWIERSCQGWADVVLVAEAEGVPSGYCTCHIREHGTGSIGLVGVSAAAQGRGLGRQLIESALATFHARRVRHVEVVTQGRNCAAQRLYQRSGFVTESVMLWYHKWIEHSAAGEAGRL